MGLKHRRLVLFQQFSNFSTTPKLLGTRKDFYYAEKMPVFEYNKVNTQKNRLYVFGTAFHGAIGLERLIKPKDSQDKKHLYMNKPVRHKFAEFHELTDIAAGGGFSLFAIKPRVENGPFVFGCGKNHFSQLGFQAVRAEGPLETLLSIIPLPFSGKKDARVLAIGAGKAHSLISIAGEGLFTLGDNSNGQCGRRIIENEQYFGSKYMHKISRFLDDPIVHIASKYDLSICVTQNGKVFTCGDNNKGQLGRGKIPYRPWEFGELSGDLEGEKVTKVTTSGSSCIALTDKGELFAWGCNEWSQVKPGEMGTFFTPVRVKLHPNIGKVTDVAIGDVFTFILNQQGNVYVWGYGSCLGLGPNTTSLKTPTQLPPPLFGCNQFNPNVQVVSIASTFLYAAAITSNGDLYTWGQNINGCLGLGKMKHQYFPLRVSLGGQAKKISLGVDHTLVIARGI